MSWKALAISISVAGFAAAAQSAAAGVSTVYTFCQLGGCQDGEYPKAPLAKDADGNLFGVTSAGGNPNNAGVVYEILRRPKHGTRYRSLYEFCSSVSCADGSNPVGRLVIDTAGNLFGVTASGGTVNSGVAFELSPAGKGKWSYTTLWSFCSGQPSCTDGAVPASGFTYAGAHSGALYDGTSPLYSFTTRGGTSGDGIAFSLQSGSGGWVLKTLYDFCPDTGTCAGGSAPLLPILDDAGNLYGATTAGGSGNGGTVFELSPISGSKYSESVVHDFCSSPNCADGATPSDLVLDSAGNLFGTAFQGGNTGCTKGCGTLFEIAPDTTFTVLYTFCARKFCYDGGSPTGITLTPSGDIYGVTSDFGSGRNGTIYRLNGSFHTLFAFCHDHDCSAGWEPFAPLLQTGVDTFVGVDNDTVYQLKR